jgi:hypothetical protein
VASPDCSTFLTPFLKGINRGIQTVRPDDVEELFNRVLDAIEEENYSSFRRGIKKSIGIYDGNLKITKLPTAIKENENVDLGSNEEKCAYLIVKVFSINDPLDFFHYHFTFRFFLL